MEEKKICVVTTTRAEYGVMRNMIGEIEKDPELELCLFVTGTHLAEAYGMTVNEIIEDGFPISEKIDILSGEDGTEGITQTMGNAVVKFGHAFAQQQPDFVIVVGDRYELLSICGAALIANIPIAHISGGEVTEGAIDDSVRHCVTKMSTLHFPACEIYRKRIIQLGENPLRVFNYGDPGVENILNTNFLTKRELEQELQISLERCVCMTFHPVTTQKGTEKEQLEQVLGALEEFPNLTFIMTKANADSGGQYINQMLEQYVRTHKNCHLFASLGIRRYISLVKISRAVIGNSSSGIIEAPVLHTPTVNIGDRQKGRLMADSILSCETQKEAITEALRIVLSEAWRERTKKADSLYGLGNTSMQIVKEIKHYLTEHAEYEAKCFFDVSFGECEK